MRKGLVAFHLALGVRGTEADEHLRLALERSGESALSSRCLEHHEIDQLLGSPDRSGIAPLRRGDERSALVLSDLCRIEHPLEEDCEIPRGVDGGQCGGVPVRVAVEALGDEQNPTGHLTWEALLQRGAQDLRVNLAGVAPARTENIDQTTHGLTRFY